jgi:SAM-dependent methyltransferase
MEPTAEFDRNYAAEQLRRSRHPLRKLVKSLYLNNILNEVSGPTIDFGCGAGQLLTRLPAGSVGLEINPYLVAELRRIGLNVLRYDPDADQFLLRDFPTGHYKTMVIAHVIEHFPDSAQTVRKIWRSCERLGILKIIVIVPGAKGYRADKTHKTFVNQRYLEDQGLLNCEGYAVTKTRYFPINAERFGEVFTYQEFKIVYERVA